MDDLPLAGRRVRSSSAAPAARMAAFLLSDLGAEVVDVPAGEPTEIADAGAAGAATAVCLSPFGLRGRFAAAPGHHSAVEAIGGAQGAQYTYTPGPAYLVSPYSTVAQALLTASATIAAMLHAPATPAPVSALQGLFAIQEGFYVFGPEREADRFTHTPRGQTPVYSTYRCADDWIFLGASTTSFMIKTLQALGLDDVLDDPRIHEAGARALRASDLGRELWERIGPILRGRPREHWLNVFEQIKVPAGPILTMEEALAHPGIQIAGLAEPGEPIGRLTHLTQVTRHAPSSPPTYPPAPSIYAAPVAAARGKRRPGTPSPEGSARPVDDMARQGVGQGPLPLSGLRVVELAGYIAGSYTGRLLADLGAAVVKIEPPDGDPFRANGYGFVAWNQGKRSLALNLRDASARARLMALVREADVLVTNYRPEALTRMGVGREEMFAVNPELIHCTVSAFGESGPLAHLPGFDPVVQAFAGIMKRQGGDDEPVKPQMAATDYLSAMLAALGVLAARAGQIERGGGYVVRTSLLAAALLLNAEAYDAVRAGQTYVKGGRDFKGPHPLNGLHHACDGWLLTVAPGLTPGLPPAHPELVEGGREELSEALRYLEAGVASDAVAEAIARLQQLGVPAVPALDPWTLTDEPHFRDNDLWIEIDQPGLGQLVLPGPVLGPAHAAPAPALGEDNDRAGLWQPRA